MKIPIHIFRLKRRKKEKELSLAVLFSFVYWLCYIAFILNKINRESRRQWLYNLYIFRFSVQIDFLSLRHTGPKPSPFALPHCLSPALSDSKPTLFHLLCLIQLFVILCGSSVENEVFLLVGLVFFFIGRRRVNCDTDAFTVYF